MTATPGPASGSSEAAPPSGPALAAARAICPYLNALDGAWRSSLPSREQGCAAVEPPAPLSVDRQRRLCLADAHVACPTYLAATAAAGARRGPRPESAARWALVRTAPVVLDQGRAVQVASRAGQVAGLARQRSGPQLALGGVLALALAAIVLSRLPASDPLLAGAQATPSASAAGSALPTRTPSPTVEPTPAVRSPTPEPTPQPTPASTPTPRPTATPAATTAPRIHRVASGDTLYDLAIRYGTTVRAIMRANDLSSTNLRVGQELIIP